MNDDTTEHTTDYTPPVLTEVGDFADLTLSAGPIPLYDGIMFGLFV